MKKYTISGAHKRARSLRREIPKAEKMLWQMLRSRQIEGWKFRRQVPIGRYIVDFICHEAKLIIEIDGGQHYIGVDTLRTQFLETEGYQVLRFWNNEALRNPDGVHAAIIESLRC